MKKLKESLEKLEKRKDTNPHYRELLDIFGEVLILREKTGRNLKKDICPILDNHVEKKLSGGLPLIDFSRGDLDLAESRNYFLSLLKIAGKINEGETEGLIRELEEGRLDYEQMVRESFSHREETEDEEESGREDLVGFLIEESLRPVLERIAGRYRESIARSDWREGYCPVCGKEPKIGELREEEGARYLFCSQCGTNWQFRRIKCPFCGNEEQKTLSYFTVEEDERYRVDVCDRCKRYIKTVDFRKTQEEADLDIEDIATLHLDVLANEEGYD
ncbi:MAG: formate dehydrogenase accessory protein FdhE [Syntrophales bacterium]|nr:formate dehydrogenase accessory protein FdhE [Syntrophales bacterium]MDD5234049.1 formate dehydrogenase accessory protein FdhE [Syntrophales bacterium]